MTNGATKEVKKCRLCGSSEIKTVFDFGQSPLANAFKSREDLDKDEFTAPLAYFKCSDCHSVQLKYEVNSSILFKEYLYESPPNLIPHFNELAKTTGNVLGLKRDDLVIDIGSNNGLLLKEYQKNGCRVYGIEPAKNIAEKARNNGIPTFNEFFNDNFAQYLEAENIFPTLITCTNCFAHLSDLNDFVKGVKRIIGNGYFVFENAYLFNTLKNLDFGQAYFEHFYMHSIWPLEQLFERHGLELFKVEYNNVQMGSIRGYVRSIDNKTVPLDGSVRLGRAAEMLTGMLDIHTYHKFMGEIDLKKQGLIAKLIEIKRNNKTISVYGWPAKMTLLNKLFDLESFIDYVIEESSLKTGKYCPGTKLKIENLDFFKSNPTDYCLIGAYNFAEDIKRKNEWYLGEWVLPL